MLGAKYLAPGAEDRVEDLPRFTEQAPILVRDRPREFVASQQSPGIVRAQDADAVIERLSVAHFGGGPSPGRQRSTRVVAADEDIVVLGTEDPQLGLEVLPVPGFGCAQVTVVCHRPRHRVSYTQYGAVLGSQRGAAREGALTQDDPGPAHPAEVECPGCASCGLHEQSQMLPVHLAGRGVQQA